jgi:hypothetical protein
MEEDFAMVMKMVQDIVLYDHLLSLMEYVCFKLSLEVSHERVWTQWK